MRGTGSIRLPLTALCVGAGIAVGAGGGADSGGGAGIACGAAIAVARGAGGAQRADLEVAHHDAKAPRAAGGGHIGGLLLLSGQAGGNHSRGIGTHVGGIDGGLQREGAADGQVGVSGWVGGGGGGWSRRAGPASSGGGSSSSSTQQPQQAPTLTIA